jgi:hypothetical protein
MTFRHHWRPDFCTPVFNRLKLKLSWNKNYNYFKVGILSVIMPHYDKANNKHSTLVQWNFYKEDSRIRVHLYSFTIHATELTRLPSGMHFTACTEPDVWQQAIFLTLTWSANGIWSVRLIWTWNGHVTLSGYCDDSCSYCGYYGGYETYNNELNSWQNIRTKLQ